MSYWDADCSPLAQKNIWKSVADIKNAVNYSGKLMPSRVKGTWEFWYKAAKGTLAFNVLG